MFEIKHKEKVFSVNDYKSAMKIYKRYSKKADYTRLYSIMGTEKQLIMVTGKRIRDALIAD